MDDINTTSDSLLTQTEAEFGAELRRELDTMNERWLNIKRLSQQQNDTLTSALGKVPSRVCVCAGVNLGATHTLSSNW